jgi:uncharacterized protein (DUF1501 family)
VPGHDALIVLFLRGGMDGLNFVLPTAGPDRAHYETARPLLRVPATGTNAALALGAWAGNEFGLHPAATGLHELYQDRRVAFVHAAGRRAEPQPFRQPGQMEPARRGRRHHRRLAHHFLTSPGLPANTPMVQRIAVSSTIQAPGL